MEVWVSLTIAAELGPCNVTENNVTAINPYSWNNVSNLLFLSQPVGTGFSYADEEAGSFDNITGAFANVTVGGPATGRWPVVDPTILDTTGLAAVAAYHVLQGFYSALPQLDAGVDSKVFNLWTESYGGHYGLVKVLCVSEQARLTNLAALPSSTISGNRTGELPMALCLVFS